MAFNHNAGRLHVRINDSDGWVTGEDEDVIPFTHDGKKIISVQEISQTTKSAISGGLRRMNRERKLRDEIENQ